MAENTYSVGYSTNARAKCKYNGCAKTIEKDEVRFSKSSSSGFSDRPKCDYYHSKCMFLSFVRARKTTKKIESMSDIEGLGELKAEDKDNIKKLLKEWNSGNMKDQVPKITRKRKADGEDEKDKKKKKTTSSKKKKNQDLDSEEEEEEIKPKKSRKVSDSDEEDVVTTKPKKTNKRKPSSDEDEDEDDDDEDEKFNSLLKGKSATNNKKKTLESDSEDEEEKKEKPQKKTTNNKKKHKSDSAEEVKESGSSEEDQTDKFLSGKIIALRGKLSLSREKVIELIKKNGGKYSKSITEDVTHVICANIGDNTKMIEKAKESGKKLVDESFLKKGR